MDQAMVDWAITAVDFGEDTTRAELWFKVLTDSYQDPEAAEPVGSWDEFVERLRPAAEREGFDSASVEYFVESLQDSSSDPIGDVVLPLYEQQDSLPQEYLELHAAQVAEAGQTAEPQIDAEQADAAQAEAEAEEQLWSWDDAQQLWLHYEDDQWVPQSQNGYALNYDKTEWVPIAAAAPVEEAAPTGAAEPAEQPAGEPEAAAPADPAEVATELLDEIAMPVMELFLAQNPEYADMPPERLAELLSEVLVEHLDQQLADA